MGLPNPPCQETGMSGRKPAACGGLFVYHLMALSSNTTHMPIKEIQANMTNRKIIVLSSVLLVLIIICATVLFFNSREEQSISNNLCYTESSRTIKGTSMLPFFVNNEEVKALINYYDCNTISRNDIVFFSFKTREGEYIKFIKALPGDKITFNSNYLLINNEYALNSEGDKYKLTSNQIKLLSIPLISNILPKNSYLVLGDNTSSQVFDSRQFGYISIEQIQGRVVKE